MRVWKFGRVQMHVQASIRDEQITPIMKTMAGPLTGLVELVINFSFTTNVRPCRIAERNVIITPRHSSLCNSKVRSAAFMLMPPQMSRRLSHWSDENWRRRTQAEMTAVQTIEELLTRT